jgi:hypothetical protein
MYKHYIELILIKILLSNAQQCFSLIDISTILALPKFSFISGLDLEYTDPNPNNPYLFSSSPQENTTPPSDYKIIIFHLPTIA